MWLHRALALALLVPLLGAAACGGDGKDDEPSPTASVSIPASVTSTRAATATASPTRDPATTQTPVQPTPERTPRPSGNELIDAVVAAAAGGDGAALVGLVHFFPVPCTGPSDGVGEAKCPPGSAPGTPVRAFAASGCDGRSITDNDPAVRAIFDDFVAAAPRFWAVAEVPPERRDERVPGDYLVIFSRTSGPFSGGGMALKVDLEGITSVQTGCGDSTPPESFAGDHPQFLVPPE